jgi:non-specific serine/threonine protein kinase/serine/threonine-protein kinase
VFLVVSAALGHPPLGKRFLKEKIAISVEVTATTGLAATGQTSGSDAEETRESAAAPAAKSSSAGGAVLKAPEQIGPYRLLRRLGEGGMGQVWLAEQTEPVRRQVALKLIRIGIYDTGIVQRFRAERQSLAMMDHPAIAKVFDAGATADGQPYFVMEYVPGVPITDYCDHKRLTLKQRLELFVEVCAGVQHAHLKAVIHRDLKPANVLIAEVDGQPAPRIIDFGLAKVVKSQPGEDLMQTQTGVWVGTPGYMSPEQADPTAGVDTRTDVYSLGVVLYILLTGDRPFDSKKWQGQPFYEIMRELREVDPPSPSSKVRQNKERAQAISGVEANCRQQSSPSSAELRGLQIRQLEVALRGDLDWITLKALERNPDCRYSSPAELAADIERYLRNNPVVARPASGLYRTRKFVRRNRVTLGIGTGLVLLLAAFVVAQAVQVRRVTRERDRAQRVIDFMQQIFKVSDPGESRGNSITARELLDKASTEIDSGLTHDPELRAQMMQTIGNTYFGLGLYKQSESLTRRALELGKQVLGSNHPETLESMNQLSGLLIAESRFPDAERLERETLGIERKVLKPDNARTIETLAYLSNTLDVEGKHEEAARAGDEMLERSRRAFSPDSRQMANALFAVGSLRWNSGNLQEAEHYARQALDLAQKTLGDDHPFTLKCLSLLSGILSDQGKTAEAEAHYRHLVEMAKRVYGPDHPRTLAAVSNLGGSLLQEGKFADAETLERTTLRAQEARVGSEDVNALVTRFRLAYALRGENRLPEAETVLRQTLEMEQRVLGPENFDTLNTMSILGQTLLEEGCYREAEAMLKEDLEKERHALAPGNPDLLATLYSLGVAEGKLGNKTEALARLREAVDQGLTRDDDLRLETDPLLTSLHDDPDFQQLAAHAKQIAQMQIASPK